MTKKKVTVIDSMMGTGKTSYAIQMMQVSPANQKFIFVTPFLDEVDRIKSSVTNRKFKEPDVKHGQGTKLQSLKKLIAEGTDIATTHALFAMADDELMELLQWENYTLILDEVMDVVSILDTLKKDDIPVLLNSGLVKIAENNQVVWIADPSLNTKYNEVKHYARAGNLYAVNNTAFLWNFPAKMFSQFEHVYILTYLFDGQIQRYYYDLHGIQYDYMAVVRQGHRYTLVSKSEAVENRSQLKELIHIYDGKLNDVGDIDTSLSHSWFMKKPKTVKTLKDNLYNYFRNIQKAKSDEILWTTFKDAKKKIHGNGFSKEEPKSNADATVGKGCYTVFNLRATNKYKHKTILAFCLNCYMNPLVEQFFVRNDVKVDEDLLALSDLLQWLFRSAIREGKAVHIYVPSKRMRSLLQQWLDGQI